MFRCLRNAPPRRSGLAFQSKHSACRIFRRHDLPRHAPLLAEDGGTFHPASGRRDMEAAGHRKGTVTPSWQGESRETFAHPPSMVEILGHFVIITVSPVHVWGTPSFKHCAASTRKCQATLSVGFRPWNFKKLDLCIVKLLVIVQL